MEMTGGNGVRFSDILTDFTCTTLTRELTKFLLYNKQQIPITYDKLLNAVQNYSKSDRIQVRGTSQSERLYKRASECVETIEEVFKQISGIFSEDILLPEVVFFFGASLFTPKQVYCLHFPTRELGHLPKYHSRQSIMTDLLKFVIASDELNRVLSKPLEPTNMFLLFKIEGDPDPSSVPWLIPKPKYKIPAFGQHAHLNLSFMEPDCCSCTCKGIEIYADESLERSPVTEESSVTCQSSYPSSSSMWYQAPLVLRGFKDVFVQGVSVSKSWMMTLPACPDEDYT